MFQGTFCLILIEPQHQKEPLSVDHDALVQYHAILAGKLRVLLINGETAFEDPVPDRAVAWGFSERITKDFIEDAEDGHDGTQAAPGPDVHQHAQHDQLNRESMSWNRFEINLRCSSLSVIVGSSYILSSFFSFLNSALSASFGDLSFDLSLTFSFRSLFSSCSGVSFCGF